MPTTRSVVEILREGIRPLTGAEADLDPLIEAVGDARLVLLGEATHGTSEFYRARAEITRRLILEKGFTAVAVEADWPDAYRVNRWVKGESADRTPEEALGGFRRFPQWMWRNTEVAAFVGWLRDHNDGLPPGAPKVGFYGLDLYSLYASIEAVIGYLDTVDPDAARRARQRYSCFGAARDDGQVYGRMVELGVSASCEEEAVRQLLELRQRAEELSRLDGRIPEDEFFYAEQNARLVLNAEEYYRSIFRGQVSSWNLRDLHMTNTLDALVNHFDEHGRDPRIAIWAHNSHLGDARATYMATAGEWNVGQLTRERHGDSVFLIGFTTYTGTVTAASDWDGPAERKRVRPALPGSVEALFHETGLPGFLIDPRAGGTDNESVAEALGEEYLERAIGVIYRPETERRSHYFEARVADQFDAILHFDETSAIEPLERTALWDRGEPPETWPFGL